MSRRKISSDSLIYLPLTTANTSPIWVPRGGAANGINSQSTSVVTRRVKVAGVVFVSFLVAAISFTYLLPYRLMKLEEVYQLWTNKDALLSDLESKYKDALIRITTLDSSLNAAEERRDVLEANLVKVQGARDELNTELKSVKEKLKRTAELEAVSKQFTSTIQNVFKE